MLRSTLESSVLRSIKILYLDLNFVLGMIELLATQNPHTSLHLTDFETVNLRYLYVGAGKYCNLGTLNS